LRDATSVNKGWVAVGLVLLVSGLAGFPLINSPAYAQTTENDTLGTSSLTDLPSNLLQSQLEPDQDSLIATPGLSADDLNPSQQDPSIIDGDERDQQTSTPNTEASSENVADEQSLDTGETIGNSIVQNPVPGSEQLENSQPGAGEQINQPRTDDNDNSAREGQRGNQEADEANDSGGNEENEEDEEDEEDEDEEEDVEVGNKGEIPSSLRNWLPFP
jgi:hypothetical protein